MQPYTGKVLVQVTAVFAFRRGSMPFAHRLLLGEGGTPCSVYFQKGYRLFVRKSRNAGDGSVSFLALLPYRLGRSDEQRRAYWEFHPRQGRAISQDWWNSKSEQGVDVIVPYTSYSEFHLFPRNS